jgi:hypothetical protein
MMEFLSLMGLALTFGTSLLIITLVAMTIWSAFVYPTEPIAILAWLVGIALNVPSLVLFVNVVTAERFPSDLNDTLVALVVFYGLGAIGIGWLAGNLLGALIRILIEKESLQSS